MTDPSGAAARSDDGGGISREACQAIGWVWNANLQRCLPKPPPPSNALPGQPRPAPRDTDPESGRRVPRQNVDTETEAPPAPAPPLPVPPPAPEGRPKPLGWPGGKIGVGITGVCIAIIVAAFADAWGAPSSPSRPPDNPTASPRPEMIWRAISLAPNRAGFNWSPTYADTDGLSGTRGGSSPYWKDPALWFEKSFGRPPDSTTDRIVATTEAALVAVGFSVENTPRLQDPQDPWHVSIGGTKPGIVSDGKGLSWPGSKAERRRIRDTLESLFTTQVWP